MFDVANCRIELVGDGGSSAAGQKNFRFGWRVAKAGGNTGDEFAEGADRAPVEAAVDGSQG